MNQTESPKTVKIDGIVYQILEEKTASDRKNEGLENIARVMNENGITRQLHLKRPNGKRFYFANEFQTKHGLVYSKVISLRF